PSIATVTVSLRLACRPQSWISSTFSLRASGGKLALFEDVEGPLGADLVGPGPDARFVLGLILRGFLVRARRLGRLGLRCLVPRAIVFRLAATGHRHPHDDQGGKELERRLRPEQCFHDAHDTSMRMSK